jgi:hypothetical protein
MPAASTSTFRFTYMPASGYELADGATVAAVPQPGPPGTLSVQQTGPGATHAVSIEPHPDAAVTTIEETRP